MYSVARERVKQAGDTKPGGTGASGTGNTATGLAGQRGVTEG